MVVLTGKVTMPYKKDDIGKRIAEIDGVRAVQNNIDVLPVSQFDEQLRYRVARAIYGNPSFWNYAAMANPPIHIIVESGRVTPDRRGEQQRRADAGAIAGDRARRVVGRSQLRTDADARLRSAVNGRGRA